ncbi:MAG: glycosyl transferase family 1, partial [Verrucomicrobiota bacterium]|nr:glycosyl transferase family 1 [Verrucomicrobiota bacterium]
MQDLEPSFYPDDKQLIERAENTYRAGFHCVTLGPWLAKLLREQYGATADHFDFAVDRKIYWPRPQLRSVRRRLCFYARPTTPRRAYDVGIAALGLVQTRLPDVEIILFGAAELNPTPQFRWVNRGLLAQEELATLFSG